MSKEALGLLLNILIFSPLLGIPFILLANRKASKVLAMIFSFIPFVLSLLLYYGYTQYSALEGAGGDFVIKTIYHWFGFPLEDGTWYSRLDIKFITGVDGISIYLILLTTLLFFLSTWFSTGSITHKEKAYYSLLLLLEVGVLGVFSALDLVVFYVFFELGLIPMYFLIGLWGGKQRIFAAVKFFLYTIVGSFLFLISIIYIGNYAADAINGGTFTSDYFKLLSLELPKDLQIWLFWGFIISFLIKLPAFPVHTWLPLAHTEAPTAGSVILAGVLLKMGSYAIIRFILPFFPDASIMYANTMAFLGVVGIIYGGMAAMMQTDIKKLVAYSSVAHMGFILLGTFALTKEAIAGSVLQMINHGISTGALFLIVGMIYDRRHTREIKDYQGIAKVMPIFTFFFMIASFSSIGLPGLNGFVGEFTILLGSYASTIVNKTYVVIATAGVIIAAVYLLWMFRRVMFGDINNPENAKLKDLNAREIGVLIPLTILMFWIGLYATPFLKEITRSSNYIVETFMK